MGATVDAEGLLAALQAWRERVVEATQAAAHDAGEVVRGAIQDNLRTSYYPPSSEPGTPPAWRTGWLHDHVYVRVLPVDEGWQARIYPSTVYARIQELGGVTGAGYRTHLPPRPYVSPARDETIPRVGQTFADAWRKTAPGG